MTYYTHHSCVRMYIVQGEEFVAVVNVFPVANNAVLVIVLALLQPFKLMCLPHYCYQSREITGCGFLIVDNGLAFL
jgi:hypothetical protein